MLRLLYRKLLLDFNISARDAVNLVPFSPQNNPSLKSASNLSYSTAQSSLTLFYLKKSCGLSPESALSASKMVTLKSTLKPDSVLAFLKNQGFSKAHISKIISKRPKLLLSNPNKTLKAKFDFFKDLGTSGSTLAALLISDPNLLGVNLKNHIIPSVEYIKALVQTNEKALLVIKRCPRILVYKVQTRIKPNISILKAHAVPETNIMRSFVFNPRALTLHPDRFGEIVAMVKEIGFDQTTPNFMLAVRVMAGLSKSNWDRKMEVYQSLGWSEADILWAFRVQPMCMITSEEKIRRVINFFVKEFSWKATVVAKCPDLLLLSINKRIVPRCSVLRVLMSRGVVRNDLNIFSVLKSTEKSFLKKFVTKHQEQIPEVLNAYQGEKGFGIEEEGQSCNS